MIKEVNTMILFLQVNSMFHMKRPYDLVSFLEQERRVEALETLRDEMSDVEEGQEGTGGVEERHDSTFEAKFFSKVGIKNLLRDYLSIYFF